MFARLAIAAFLICASTAQAAEVYTVGSRVFVKGRLANSDISTFRAAVRGMRNPVTVVFDSDGGAAGAGLVIGEEIKRRGFATMVPKGKLCVSACAFAWLAGEPKIVEEQAKVGFHSVFVMENGKPVVNAPANALVGSYMTTLGFSPAAIVFATEARPDAMNWLDPKKAKKLGFTVYQTADPKM